MIPVRTTILLLFAWMFGTACSVILGTEEQGADMLLPPPSHQPPYDVYLEGQPEAGLFSVEGGYYVWKSGHVFSLRVITRTGAVPFPGKTVFSGVVSVEQGVMKETVRKNLRAFDDVWSRIHDIGFSLEEKPEISGFDFEIQPLGPEYCVLFDLRINGRLVPASVHLGRFRTVPDTLPLRVCFR